MRKVLLLLALYLGIVNSYVVRQSASVRTTRQVEVQNEKRIVCYYSSWAVDRLGEYKFTPEDINPHLCTHLIYAFGIVDDGDIVPLYPQTNFDYEWFVKFTKLKTYNENLKVMLSLGGTKEGPTRFSKLVSDDWTRKRFPRNARIFLQKYNFDGLDIDWHHPGGLTLGSKSSDKENFVELLKELKENFKDEFLLSISVPKYKAYIELGFDIPRLAKYLDFMNILTYDYHNPTDAYVNHVAPLYPISKTDSNENVDATIRDYIGLGVDPGMLNMGIPLYGITFLLEDTSKTDIGSNTWDEGDGKPERGQIYFNEFCDKFKSGNWTIKHVNKTAMGPYAYMKNEWMSFDDEDMVKTKARYAANKNLGGIMFWSVDMDDFKARCHTRTYPMIRGAKEAFLSKPSTESNITTPDPTTSTTPTSSETTQTDTTIIPSLATMRSPTEISLPSRPSTSPNPSGPKESSIADSPVPTSVPTTASTIIPSLATKRSPVEISLPSRPSTNPNESSVTISPVPTSVPTTASTIIPFLASKRPPTENSLPSTRPNPTSTSIPIIATTSNPLTTYVFPKTEGNNYHSDRDINFSNVQNNFYISLNDKTSCLVLDGTGMSNIEGKKLVLKIIPTQ